jgi:hypothetical protein
MSIAEREKKLNADKMQAGKDIVILFMKEFLPQIRKYKIKYVDFDEMCINFEVDATINNVKFIIILEDIHYNYGYRSRVNFDECCMFLKDIKNYNGNNKDIIEKLCKDNIIEIVTKFLKDAYHLTFNTTRLKNAFNFLFINKTKNIFPKDIANLIFNKIISF